VQGKAAYAIGRLGNLALGALGRPLAVLKDVVREIGPCEVEDLELHALRAGPVGDLRVQALLDAVDDPKQVDVLDALAELDAEPELRRIDLGRPVLPVRLGLALVLGYLPRAL
jgi:hypothetical protein